MTWKEFCDVVDNRLKELGTDENVPIDYIDVSPGLSGLLSPDEIVVTVDKACGLAIG